MGLVLKQLADELGVSERTLRRAVGSELIRARRPSARRLHISEQEWVRRHWSLVARLRGALRTEPNLELAVLFGSVARGDDVAGVSDVDLLVRLRRMFPGALEALRLALGAQLGAEVQIVPLDAALNRPRLLAEILRDGRPLVDRGEAWPRLQAQATHTQILAEVSGEESREEARRALHYFREVSAARAESPVGARS